MTSPIDIAFGYNAGFKQFQATGFNGALSDVAWYVLGPALTEAKTAAFAANDIALADTAGTLSVTRANAGDTGKVTVIYLDADYKERAARYDMSVSPATVDEFTGGPITARRANQARYNNGANLGTIDIRVGTGLVNRIAAGDGIARVCLFTLPYGQPTAFTGWIFAAQATKPVEARLRVRAPGKQAYTLATLPARETLESSILPFPLPVEDIDFDSTPPARIVTGLDLWVEMKRPSGGGSGEATAILHFMSQRTGLDPDAFGYV